MRRIYQCELRHTDKVCGKEFPSFQALNGHKGGMKKAERTPFVIRHGTNWGYQQHLKVGVEPCQKCREAHASHNRS